MSTDELVSICLPVFNGAPFLESAIASVLAQTYQSWELVICDDGSTDGSVELVRKLAEGDTRIRFQSNAQRLGLFGNYNETIRQARGEYIKTFAQDDLLEPTCVKQLVRVLQENKEIALVSSARQWIDGGGTRIDLRAPFPRSMRIPAREVLTFNLINLNNWIGEPSTVMFRKAVAGEGFSQLYYHYGDIEYWLRLLSHGDYYFVSDVLCSFRRHRQSQTDKNHQQFLFALDVLRISLDYRHVLADIESDETFRRRISETLGIHLQHLHDEGLSRQDYAQSFLQGSATDASPAALAEAERRASGFRLLAAFALESLTDALKDLDHEQRCRADEHERFVGEVDKMRNSLYWKLTGPLRSLRDAVRGPQ